MKTIYTTLLCCCLGMMSLMAQQDKITLVIHGGAGTIRKQDMTPEREAAYHAKMEEALKAGYTILRNGGTSMDAVVETIKILEDSPLFNAGKGAVFTSEGKNELDAALMDGKTLKAGAVAGITTVKNPITAARAVMEHTEHVMLIGQGAEQFAREQNLTIVEPTYFHTPERASQIERIKEKERQNHNNKDQGAIPQDLRDYKFGTVGCVALDQYGNLVAGTSTGGMTNKKYGRVGDTPIIGAGTYADNASCAVSATGHGEFFIRYVVAYDIAALVKYAGKSVSEAGEEVLMRKLVAADGEGGVIILDKHGNLAMPFNSEGMYRGYIKADGKAHTFIYQNE
ncbi:isoaspartyl peptidase/L-asparaginase family protein [Eisenibacter elegans]|uniref:isoaspartyl peptidase/L-asparaginase family protein n=1 Tax=Eisenibacter elegans TaxID=997 RepID=UPI000417FB25|nr:isoaspartyl peptidase/L-asparaginase [Eisenibacter elegans]